MNEQEHLLVVLAEECGEAIQEACKALRFGMGDTKPGQPDDNRRRLERELAQALAVAEMLGLQIREEDKLAKREKLYKYMDYARAKGTLEPSLFRPPEKNVKWSAEDWTDWFKQGAELQTALMEKKELQEIVVGLLEEDGLQHESGCPEDDTCACVFVKRVNAAMKGYGEKREGP